MSAALFTAVVFLAVGADGNAAIDSSAAVRQPHELRQAIREALAREATAKTAADRYAAVQQLAQLYREITEDQLMAQEERLQQRAKLWSRLTRIRTQVEQQLARQRAAQARAARSQGPATGLPEASPGAVEEQMAALLASQFALVSQAAGGPASLVVEARGGRGTEDYGEELVDLITRTIAPHTWDVNGGPGSIFYFHNLKVLVVRQMGDVHDDVGGLLDGLRRAGGF